ncbi:MAG: hypothetical protein QXK33_04715 [Candidatus Bathyarchaeia archaeon]
MSGTKYGKYILREPLEKGPGAPSIHACGHEDCYGSVGFPAELQLLYITRPFTMKEMPHVHDVDELLFIWGGNPSNFFEFDAEIELYLGEEQEMHLIDTTAIVYIPKGLPHCPIIIRRVGKPFMWGHILFKAVYPPMPGFPKHSDRVRYSPEEARVLRGR